MTDDYFREDGTTQPLMRKLLEREAALRAPRFGIARRDFLGSAMGALASMTVLNQAPGFGSYAEAQEKFQPPSDDCYAELHASRAAFSSIDQSNALDWQLIQAASNAQQRALADMILSMLWTLETLYVGFAVHQLAHMTQTATRALRANASDEQVLVALVHDVGKVISVANHPEIVSAIARPYVSHGAYRSLRHHMEFQWQHYGDKLGLPTDLRQRYVNEPWYAQTALFTDEWDQTSFDPSYNSLPLKEFEPLVRQMFARPLAPASTPPDECL